MTALTSACRLTQLAQKLDRSRSYVACEAAILAREFTPSKRRDQLARGKRAFVAADEEAAEPLLAIA